MGVFLRLSRADNSIVGGPIWPKFELLLDIMQVLDAYKFKWIGKIATEKTGKHRFFPSKAADFVAPGQIWPNFELIQVLMCVIVACKYEKDPIKTA